MPDPDKEQQQALAQLESRVNACTADLEKRHAEHWKEVGTALWSETQTVAVANGIFSVRLGFSRLTRSRFCLFARLALSRAAFAGYVGS